MSKHLLQSLQNVFGGKTLLLSVPWTDGIGPGISHTMLELVMRLFLGSQWDVVGSLVTGGSGQHGS